MSIVKDHGKTKQRQEASGFSKVILPDDQNQSPDEDEEEDQEQCPFEFKTGFDKFFKKGQPVTYDDLLYHPCEDENN